MMSAYFCQKIPPPSCQTLSEIIRPSSYMTSESSQPLPLQKQNKKKHKKKRHKSRFKTQLSIHNVKC